MKKPIPVAFESNGANIHAIFYQASGVEPLPTVILCHGFPGDEGDVFGLGDRLMKEGVNALARAPNTINGKTGLICRFIGSPKDLENLTIPEVVDMSKTFLDGYPEPLESPAPMEMGTIGAMKTSAKNSVGAA